MNRDFDFECYQQEDECPENTFKMWVEKVIKCEKLKDGRWDIEMKCYDDRKSVNKSYLVEGYFYQTFCEGEKIEVFESDIKEECDLKNK